MDINLFLEDLKANLSVTSGAVDEVIIENAVLSNYGTFKIGGMCDIMVNPCNVDDIITTIKLARKHNIPYYIIGNASNILFSDDGIRGVVIRLNNNFSKYSIGKEDEKTGIVEVECEAGISLKDLSKHVRDYSLTGLEFACGIPGNVGGASYMNAGAYGGDTKGVVIRVQVLDKDLNILTLSRDEMEYGYRKSIAQDAGYIILKVVYGLKMGYIEDISMKMKELTDMREDKQPLEFGSIGSVFKRPEGHFAGKLIEDSGLAGRNVGGAYVSEKHCGFIVNKGGATEADVLELVKIVKKTVEDNYGVTLEREFKRMP